MENFVFPDAIKIISENVWIDEHFFYFYWNSAKKLQKVIFFYFHWKNSQKGLYVLDCYLKGNESIKKSSTCGPSNFYLLRVQTKIRCYE